MLKPGFTLGDPDLLADLPQESGFSELEITSHSLSLWHRHDGIRIPEIIQRTAGFLPVLANKNLEARDKLAVDVEAEIAAGLAAYLDGDRHRSPSTALIGLVYRY